MKKNSEIPNDFKYTETHEWAEKSEKDEIIVGITDHAQHSLGDIVFVELPEVGQTLSAGEEFGVIESVKAASDLYLPISGEVIAVNEALKEQPNLINSDPYGSGWIVKIQPQDLSDWENMMDANAYAEILETETEE